MSKVIIGIDPGRSGAMAVLYPDNSVEFLDVPSMKMSGKAVPAWTLWAQAWSHCIASALPDLVVLERVSAMPGQGVTSMFNFGRSLGFVHALALVADAPIHMVTPAVWKGKLGLLKADKNASREKAVNLFPGAAMNLARVKDDGRAEALLLAYYGTQYL